MTLRQFLNAAYAMLVGEAQRIGMDILSAKEAVDRWINMPGAPPEQVGPSASDNDRALAELNEMMKGVTP